MKRLDDLPRHLRSKIRLEPADAPETEACWIWTGSAQKPRRRLRPYAPIENENPRVRPRHFAGSFVNDRETPMVRDPSLGYAVAAHRVTYAAATDRTTASLPRLSRCSCDRCVSPHHVHELDEVSPRSRGRTRGGIVAPEPEVNGAPVPSAKTWDLLTAEDGPMIEVGVDAACAEVGLPPGSITPAMWDRFVKWSLARDGAG
ncbi:hypothetical protein [Methylobacterium aquaticum]|uniref:Uncharacterized protein n=1 Tax=Methylobacterium aquaticum TaxID=270351 RepID=A0A0C6G2H9_9HYPH|nr:hypothetical protein [Methylobacterium aquaticum]BAQ50315.1 hypothetical protein Maq22A_3p50320 [Methylobacterium aquaticum]